jgi:uncharacterized membrane protein
VQQKLYNFDTLNQRVLKKLGFQIPRPVIEDIVNCRPGAIENVLNALQYKMAKYREKKLQQEGKSLQGTPPKEQSPNLSNEKRANAEKNVSKEKNRPASSQPISKNGAAQSNIDNEILQEKEQQIRELQETVEILELKVAKLEQLVRLKDNKIQKLIQMNGSDK